jgi:NAD(P) transhydrogenase
MTTNGYDFDLIVIGSGPAGQKGAMCAAELRKRVAIVDRRWAENTGSLRNGTISSKILRQAVFDLRSLRQRLYGQNSNLKAHINMSELAFRVDAVTRRDCQAVQAQLQRSQVEIFGGEARFVDAHTIQVQTDQETKLLTSDNFLIAVGSRPCENHRIPIDGRRVYNSEQLLALREVPRDLIIVGAGLIGIEYGAMLAALGAKITLIEERPELLGFADREVVAALCSQLQKLGVTLRLGQKVVECGPDAKREGRVVAKLASGASLSAESLLYAAGRRGNTDGLNLEPVGIQTTDGGKIPVNDQFQTDVPNIFAAGDVIGFPVEDLYYASISMEQGRLASCNMFGFPALNRLPVMPFAIYAIPEISMVGRTERDLTSGNISYEAGRSCLGELTRGQILGEDYGFLKLLFDPDSLKLLGVHIIGEGAAEIIHIGQAVLSFGGTIEYFRNTVFNYPTIAEAYRVAALDGLLKVGLLPRPQGHEGAPTARRPTNSLSS